MVLIVYKGKVEGTDEEIYKQVRDWYYMQGCAYRKRDERV